MRKILVVNPGKKSTKKPAKKKAPVKRKLSAKGAPMAKKKRKGKKPGPKKGRRRNPSSRKRNVRRASSAISRSFMGLNFKTVLKELPYIQVGMFASKWAAKRLGEDANEEDPDSWNYMSYLKGSLGGVGAALLMNSVKPGSGQKVLSGAINLMAYKAIQNELISKSEWAEGQFGAADDDYFPDEYLMTGTDEDPIMFSDDGDMMPADDRHRLPEIAMDGSVLQRPGPLGDYGASVLETPGRLGMSPFTTAYNL